MTRSSFLALALLLAAGCKSSAPDARPSGPQMNGDATVYVSGYGDAIRVLRLDGRGALVETSSADGAPNPAYGAATADGRFMYFSNEADPGKVTAFAIGAGGALTRLGDVSAGGKGTVHLVVHPRGRHVIYANYVSGNVAVRPILDDGRLGEPTADLPAGDKAHQVAVSPDGRYVFVPVLGNDAIARFRFDPDLGSVTPTAAPRIAVEKGPRHMAFHPSGRFVYVLHELIGTLVAYDYDATTGDLLRPQSLELQPDERAAAHVAISPDGRFVFASVRTKPALFSVPLDPATGRFGTPVRYASDDIAVPRDFAVDPSGRFLLVAAQNLGTVQALAIDPTTGALTPAGAPVPVSAKPAFVGILAPR